LREQPAGATVGVVHPPRLLAYGLHALPYHDEAENAPSTV
jgi:hypothetical protein